MPKVSVILPVYDGEKYLAEAIDSVLAQTFSDWELIIVNDGSTDGSGEIIDRYVKGDPRIRAFYQENSGQSSARNFGAQESTADYVAFIDQDDRFWPTKLQKTISFFERRPDYGMVYSDFDLIDRKGRVFTASTLTSGRPPLPPGTHPKYSLLEFLRGDAFILPGASVIRRELFRSIGGFDPRLSGYEDDDLFLRIFQRARMHFLKEALLQWRVYGSSYSYSARMDASRVIFFQKLVDTFREVERENLYEDIVANFIMPRICDTYVSAIIAARKIGDRVRLVRLHRNFSQVANKPLVAKIQQFALSPWMPFFVFRILQKIYRRFHR